VYVRYFWPGITRYTVKYDVYVRFWPTLGVLFMLKLLRTPHFEEGGDIISSLQARGPDKYAITCLLPARFHLHFLTFQGLL